MKVNEVLYVMKYIKIIFYYLYLVFRIEEDSSFFESPIVTLFLLTLLYFLLEWNETLTGHHLLW